MNQEAESIHDLFQRVREHPDFVFGTIFVKDDFPNEEVRWAKWFSAQAADKDLNERGQEYILENNYLLAKQVAEETP
jgi:hypothetical protein